MKIKGIYLADALINYGALWEKGKYRRVYLNAFAWYRLLNLECVWDDDGTRHYKIGWEPQENGETGLHIGYNPSKQLDYDIAHCKLCYDLVNREVICNSSEMRDWLRRAGLYMDFELTDEEKSCVDDFFNNFSKNP